MFLRRLTMIRLPIRRHFNTTSTLDFDNAIAELNKEMESVFGEPPPASLGSSNSSTPTPHEPHSISLQIIEKEQTLTNISTIKNEQSLTHISTTGEAQMVDISSKENTKRVAIAGCKVILGKKVFDLVSANQIAKGDVLSVARIAGISGAKQTCNLIPLCHNISLSNVRVDLKLNEKDSSVEIESEAVCIGKTGVEMEAMTAATVAGLTVYDMCKAASKDIQITDVRLKHKSGGKSGLHNFKVSRVLYLRRETSSSSFIMILFRLIGSEFYVVGQLLYQ